MEFYQKTSENQKVAPCDPQKPETWNLILKTANLKPETSFTFHVKPETWNLILKTANLKPETSFIVLVFNIIATVHQQ